MSSSCILVVGSGAREHALAWRLARDAGVARVLAAPGNAGLATIAELEPVSPTDIDGLVSLVRRRGVDLTVVGPEAPLAAGIADRFALEGLPLVGPSRQAAALETSKAFAKAFMVRHGVPTAAHRACATPEAATCACDELGYPVVVKADGLAAGKGVVVAPDRATALAAVDAMMVRQQFGGAGASLVIERCLDGPELSVFVLSDGRRFTWLGAAHDHKRAYDDDRGPNTGGMGAYAPSPLMTDALRARITTSIVEPVIAGMAAEGHPYRGFLYVGLMLTREGPQVIEFNVRFGDPEAQVVLPLVKDGFVAALREAAAGSLSTPLVLGGEPHVGVVLASGGYPDAFETGKPISGLEIADTLPDVLVFHAGTTRDGTRFRTSGGRVLTVVGRGSTFEGARARAYAAADVIDFDGKHARRDIGMRAIASVSPGERP